MGIGQNNHPTQPQVPQLKVLIYKLGSSYSLIRITICPIEVYILLSRLDRELSMHRFTAFLHSNNNRSIYRFSENTLAQYSGGLDMEAFPIPRVEGGGGKGWSRSCLYTLASAWCLLSSPTRGQCPGPGSARQPGPDPVPSRAQAAATGQSAIREMRRRSQEARTPRHRSRHPALCKHWPRSEAPCVFCMNE